MSIKPTVLEYPKVISMEYSESDLHPPFARSISPQQTQELLNSSHRGVTHRDGKWRIQPSPDWKIEKQAVGLYRIDHDLEEPNTSLSVSLLVQPGSFEIKVHSPYYFVVQTTLDGQPKDLDFSFSLFKVISLPVR